MQRIVQVIIALLIAVLPQHGWSQSTTQTIGNGIDVQGLIETQQDSLTSLELDSFTAGYENGSIGLQWITRSEFNNARFEVERSVRTHEKGARPWATLAFVSGAGTTPNPTTYEYYDKGDVAGASQVLYRLKQVSFDGSTQYSEVIEARLPAPKAYAVSSYTNPYSVSATIEYDIPQRRRVRLTIYDEEGRKVETLVNQIKSPGRYRAVFNALNQDPGLYMYRLEVSGKVWVEPILLVR